MKCSWPVTPSPIERKPVGLGRLVVGALRQAQQRDRDQVLGPGLLLGVTPSTPPRSIGFVGSYSLAGGPAGRVWPPPAPPRRPRGAAVGAVAVPCAGGRRAVTAAVAAGVAVAAGGDHGRRALTT